MSGLPCGQTSTWPRRGSRPARFAGRICVDLDVDRESVTRFGTPAQIGALTREEVTQLGRLEGGLMMVYGLYPGVPLGNVRALMDAMTRYAGFYS